MKITDDKLKQLKEVVENLGGTPYGESKRSKIIPIKTYPIMHELVSEFYRHKVARLVERLLLEQMEKDGFIPSVLPKKQTGAEPADMDTYAASKKEKIALEEIRERVEKKTGKSGPAKSNK